MINVGFLTGTISKYISEKIGFETMSDRFVSLKSKCEMYSDKRTIKAKNVKPELTLEIFSE